MRWPEAKILEAIVHPDKQVRQAALRYFGDSYSPSQAVMPQVIQALDIYGLEAAFQHRIYIANLAQSEATIDWAIRELRQLNSGPYCSIRSSLCQLLSRADPVLLAARQEEILALPQFGREYHAILKQRVELASWDGEQCWRELESMCDRAAKAPNEDSFDWRRSDFLAEALGRQGQAVVGRVLELLGDATERTDDDPVHWMETFLVQAAGHLRLEPAIPLLVAKLRLDNEMCSDECVVALTRIGTDAAALAVAKNWQDEPWEYRMDASGCFDNLHCDALPPRILELLPAEEDLDIKTSMAMGLLGNFATEGIEPVRQLILAGQYAPTHADLQRELVTAATLMEAHFAEFDEWKAAADRRSAEQEKRMKEFDAWKYGPRRPAPPPTPEPRSERPTTFVRAEERVGRNDACPCGSGKKFKKCCLTKSRV